MRRMIGLTGRAGAGKNYVAEQLCMATNHVYSMAAFAHALRWEIEEELGIGMAPALWAKPTSEPVRFILQQYGTNFRRAQDQDYWVNRAFDYYSAGPYVWTDVRFPNEARKIQLSGGLVVRVLAPPEVREERLGTLPPEHASETSMDHYDVDMHITSTEENLAFEGQINRILVEATYESGTFLNAIAQSLERG